MDLNYGTVPIFHYELVCPEEPTPDDMISSLQGQNHSTSNVCLLDCTSQAEFCAQLAKGAPHCCHIVDSIEDSWKGSSPLFCALTRACAEFGGVCGASFYHACAGQASGAMRKLQKAGADKYRPD